MKPDWDKLMDEFQGSSTLLIADVDCTAAGKSKCEEVGVKGFPTIKYGDPDDLQDYKGGRTFTQLKEFADGLGPQCSPGNLDLCDEEKKKRIAEYQALSPQDRIAAIKEKEDGIAKLEADFKSFVEGLNKQYKTESEKKDKGIEEVKSSGLGLLKSVQSYMKKAGGKTEL
mmetsp:Transcript_22677/g.63004  ORF Transcript_22677/g.63004 Transcript_22677/m.63004 type:complete len:170 (-) Transcript_22677:155-664(-)